MPRLVDDTRNIGLIGRIPHNEAVIGTVGVEPLAFLRILEILLDRVEIDRESELMLARAGDGDGSGGGVVSLDLAVALILIFLLSLIFLASEESLPSCWLIHACNTFLNKYFNYNLAFGIFFCNKLGQDT